MRYIVDVRTQFSNGNLEEITVKFSDKPLERLPELALHVFLKTLLATYMDDTNSPLPTPDTPAAPDMEAAPCKR